MAKILSDKGSQEKLSEDVTLSRDLNKVREWEDPCKDLKNKHSWQKCSYNRSDVGISVAYEVCTQQKSIHF